MPDTELGLIIGERELIGAEGKRILIRIGQPQSLPDNSCFFCPYQIVGIGNDRVRRVLAGMDSIDAIQITLQKIGIDLHVLNESLGWALHWDAGGERDLGFPLPKNILNILNES